VRRYPRAYVRPSRRVAMPKPMKMPKFTADEKEQLQLMGVDDPQNLGWGDLATLIPKLVSFFKTATSLLEKLGPIFGGAAQQAALKEEDK
jgi:hypothetical protein